MVMLSSWLDDAFRCRWAALLDLWENMFNFAENGAGHFHEASHSREGVRQGSELPSEGGPPRWTCSPLACGMLGIGRAGSAYFLKSGGGGSMKQCLLHGWFLETC